jgi:UDPglucose--hexose-1-phosphate uridylyltransferase
MPTFDYKSHAHRRFNPLTREWVLVSPQRTQRPWQGQVEAANVVSQPEYDPACYMCPGNTRATGVRNPSYSGTFVFDNDYPALVSDSTEEGAGEQGLFAMHSESGICRVVCFSPKHNLTLARMPLPEIRRVVDVWVEQHLELRARPSLAYVQIFENRGEMMGASNPHPHGQIWASSSVPDLPAKEQSAQQEYSAVQHSCLLCDYLSQELKRKERAVIENDCFSAIVPFWAVWPFETIVIPKRHLGSFPELSGADRDGLADILKRLTTCYDNLFQTSFPYSMGFHQSPSDGSNHPEWHFHAHFYPPLLRSATVRKFMVGYEMLARAQRDITPEDAAARLREADRS